MRRELGEEEGRYRIEVWWNNQSNERLYSKRRLEIETKRNDCAEKRAWRVILDSFPLAKNVEYEWTSPLSVVFQGGWSKGRSWLDLFRREVVLTSSVQAFTRIEVLRLLIWCLVVLLRYFHTPHSKLVPDFYKIFSVVGIWSIAHYQKSGRGTKDLLGKPTGVMGDRSHSVYPS